MRNLTEMFGILMALLNADRPLTRKELAAKFEISERSVSRYVDAMSATCDIPISVTYGAHGGYGIADNYRLNRTYFTAEEYERALAALSALSGELDDEVMSSLKDKLTHLSADADGDKYLFRNERLVIDSSSWQNSGAYRNTISALNRAIEEKRTVKISYVDKLGSQSVRDFDAYTLVLKEGVWYVYGWCHAREDFRLFKLSRIKELILTAENFEPKHGADVYKKLSEEFITRKKTDIKLEFDAEALPAIEEWLGIDSVSENGGKYRAKGYVYSEDLLIGKLLALGSHVKVLSPSYVAEELCVELRRALNGYSDKTQNGFD